MWQTWIGLINRKRFTKWCVKNSIKNINHATPNETNPPPLHPDYSAVGIAAYVAELEWEKNRKLKEELEEVRNKSVNVDKFYSILLDPPMVARLQAVSVQTVRAYIKDGAILSIRIVPIRVHISGHQ